MVSTLNCRMGGTVVSLNLEVHERICKSVILFIGRGRAPSVPPPRPGCGPVPPHPQPGRNPFPPLPPDGQVGRGSTEMLMRGFLFYCVPEFCVQKRSPILQRGPPKISRIYCSRDNQNT